MRFRLICQPYLLAICLEEQMDPDKFSFSKKPISLSKRTSVISATLDSRESPERSPNNYTTRPERRTFSSHTEVLDEKELSGDDPLLDYDAQIRAPKFLSKKSLDDIGSAVDLARVQSSPAQSSEMLVEGASQGARAAPYQPAQAELPSEELDQQPSTSSSTNYTLSQITPLNLISNLQHQNTNRSAISSKKGSEDSITILSRKAPHFNTAPIRPMTDPRTPNYVPCVLRPNEQGQQEATVQSMLETLDSDARLSREHWKPNSSTIECTDCGRAFSLMNRRHHCRKCGDLFCAPCLLSKAKLSFRCLFDVDGVMTKVCFQCGKQWSSFLVESFKMNLVSDFRRETGLVEESRKGREAVPADWTWSSF